jgi:hypothetical protein
MKHSSGAVSASIGTSSFCILHSSFPSDAVKSSFLLSFLESVPDVDAKLIVLMNHILKNPNFALSN